MPLYLLPTNDSNKRMDFHELGTIIKPLEDVPSVYIPNSCSQ
jgi:hypothetical protein